MNRNFNLPPGVSLSDLSKNEPRDCETCGGEGHTGCVFCGGHVDTDMGICVKCKDHSENEVCPDCKGEGVIYPEN